MGRASPQENKYMTKLSGTSYPGLVYKLNQADLAGSGAAVTGPVVGYVKLESLPAGAVILYANWKVRTAAAGVTTVTGRLVTADAGTQNNQVNYGAATDLKTTATDVTAGLTKESKAIARDLLFRVDMATGAEV